MRSPNNTRPDTTVRLMLPSGAWRNNMPTDVT
jgi:hypothetical protein